MFMFHNSIAKYIAQGGSQQIREHVIIKQQQTIMTIRYVNYKTAVTELPLLRSFSPTLCCSGGLPHFLKSLQDGSVQKSWEKGATRDILQQSCECTTVP